MSSAMKMRLRAAFLVLAAAASLAVASPARTETADGMNWKPWKLGHLSKYIGSDQFEPILSDPQVQKTLQNIVGDSFPHLMRNMEVRLSHVDLVGGWIILKGGMSDAVYREQAVLVIDLFNGLVDAGIFSNGHRTVFSVKEEYLDVPVPLLEWVWSKEIASLRFKVPDTNFTYKKYEPRK